MNQIQFKNGSKIIGVDLASGQVNRSESSNYWWTYCYCPNCNKEYIRRFDIRKDSIPITNEDRVIVCNECDNDPLSEIHNDWISYKERIERGQCSKLDIIDDACDIDKTQINKIEEEIYSSLGAPKELL